jgi:hypothetical protein
MEKRQAELAEQIRGLELQMADTIAKIKGAIQTTKERASDTVRRQSLLVANDIKPYIEKRFGLAVGANYEVGGKSYPLTDKGFKVSPGSAWKGNDNLTTWEIEVYLGASGKNAQVLELEVWQKDLTGHLAETSNDPKPCAWPAGYSYPERGKVLTVARSCGVKVLEPGFRLELNYKRLAVKAGNALNSSLVSDITYQCVKMDSMSAMVFHQTRCKQMAEKFAKRGTLAEHTYTEDRDEEGTIVSLTGKFTFNMVP